MRFPVLALLAIPWGGMAATEITPGPINPDDDIRGVVISCQSWGGEWGSDAMVEALAEIKALGANWVQIHPYGSVDRDGNITLGRLDPDGPAPDWIARPIAEAHRLGLKICITPHLAPWRAGWRWRGEIDFDSPEKWARFFRSYRTWITTLARFCRDADGFSVGSELDRTVWGHERAWREIIAGVRAETPAALTYAANWPDYQRIPFWDAVDVISLSAYFNLVDHDQTPTAAELDRSWQRILAEARTYAAAQNRRIVFMELGYDRSLDAAREPWADGPRGEPAPGAEALQTLCLDRALTAVAEPDAIIGTFLWKWFAGPVRRASFLVSTPAMRTVVAQHWAEPMATSRSGGSMP